MEQAQYLIDSNAVIDYLGNRLTISGMNFMSGARRELYLPLLIRNFPR